MARVARITDLAKCPKGIGPIVTGSSRAVVENQKLARIGDKGRCSCGGVYVIITGSPTGFEQHRRIARMGDLVRCACGIGVIITGAKRTYLDGLEDFATIRVQEAVPPTDDQNIPEAPMTPVPPDLPEIPPYALPEDPLVE